MSTCSASWRVQIAYDKGLVGCNTTDNRYYLGAQIPEPEDLTIRYLDPLAMAPQGCSRGAPESEISTFDVYGSRTCA